MLNHKIKYTFMLGFLMRYKSFILCFHSRRLSFFFANIGCDPNVLRFLLEGRSIASTVNGQWSLLTSQAMAQPQAKMMALGHDLE